MQWLEREGGHIIVGIVLLGIALGMWLIGAPKYDDVVMFALGVLARSMVGRKDRPASSE